MALNGFSPGDFMVSIDLKNAYFGVPIFQPRRKYLLAFLLGTALHHGF